MNAQLPITPKIPTYLLEPAADLSHNQAGVDAGEGERVCCSVQALLPGCDHVAADIPGLRLDHEAAPGVGVAGLEVVDDGSEQWRVVRLSVDSLVLAQLAHCALRIQRRCWKGVWNNLVRGNRACAAEQSLQI